jgi:hypothetical protein
VTTSIAAQDEKFEGTIVVNDEYASLIPGLSKEEFESLKQLIKEDNGLTYAIIVNQHGAIVDGYHTYKAWQELKIKPKFQVKFFENPLLEQKFRIKTNMNHGRLNPFQRIELAYKLKAIDNEIQKLDKTLPNTLTEAPENSNKNQPPIGRALDLYARSAGVSQTTYFKGVEIIKNAPEEMKDKLRKGKVKVEKAYGQLQKQQQRQELVNAAASISQFPTNNVKLVLGDFNEKSKEVISDNSIDLLFTDPPYGSKYLPSYNDLARLGARVLKDGGSLVTYVGNYAIPQVIHMMESAGLKYWWMLAVNLEGSFARHYPRKVSIKWKPLLWFVEGDKPNNLDFISDAINSKRPSKVIQDLEQSTVDAEHVISRLTVENQTVLDQMMGSGTTGVAALKLKRKFIGIEIVPSRFERARARLSKVNE